MEKSKFFKRRIILVGIIFVVTIGLIFGFLSFRESASTKTFEKFINNFKEKNFEESFKYVADNEYKNILDSYVKNSLISIDEEISNRIFKFTYNIIETIEEGSNSKIKVKVNYYDLIEGYKNALDEFLAKALDFENLDDLYSKENLDNILITHIKKLKPKEEEIDIELIKNKNWEVILNDKILEIITGNSIKLLTILKENSIGK